MNTLLTLGIIIIAFVAIFYFSTKVSIQPQPRNILNAVLAFIAVLLIIGVILGRVPLVQF